MTRRLAIPLALIASLMAGCRTQVQSPPAFDLQYEEYAVYSVVFEEILEDSDRIVVRESTTLNTLDDDKSSIVEYILESSSGLDEEIIREFLRSNSGSLKLSDNPYFDSSVQFISQEEIDAIFDGGGWEEFYPRYPDSPGYVSLSRVSFDSEFRHALVYIGLTFHYLGGSGHYFVLEKVSGKWIVNETLLAWIA